ncbi:hypothetical protein PTNB73_08696 [Pyrenophora teres f. teres]|uniref:2EXR domain-containing protein n=1 Tax=Pyrenophora teres f. teres TaxID=97479 RepID=A0A6S6WGV6_9PLEO|nr:hypothetical protein HRS9139_08809 [Pyrenophora teres f. teres]KAE8834796.1 hypothetical protein PTNB85_06129 [Pyrenophora teres f. teres]KAE8859216.1 hypothetical protein PTNB73_08696 [Pyrenophora teres f. teres]KAE8861084.1 hypothetical protein PTNB29_06179 [Pyrenophora teres f. teres]CAE7194017.1 hypothetical protein PTTW11_07870 [Pyrenophora teres f. teres]
MATALAITAQKLEMITQENQLQSPFLRLPAELRTRIYELACANEVVHVYYPNILPRVPYNLIYLLQICRQIRYEAEIIFYSTCSFAIHTKIVASKPGIRYAGGSNVTDIATIGREIWSWSKALITSMELDNIAAEGIWRAIIARRSTLASKQATEARASTQSGKVVLSRLSNQGVGNAGGVRDDLVYAEGFTALQKIHVYHNRFTSRTIERKFAVIQALRVGFHRPNLVLTSEESIAITESNQLTSPLLRLPAELRNKIYEYACIDTTVRAHQVMNLQIYRSNAPVSKRKPLAVISTCKQMRHEASEIFYSHTTFDLIGPGLSAYIPPCVHRRITSILITDIQLLRTSSAFLCGLKRVRFIGWFEENEEPILSIPPQLREFHGEDLEVKYDQLSLPDFLSKSYREFGVKGARYEEDEEVLAHLDY